MNKELEKAKKIFGKDINIENEDVLKKAYKKLVKLYSENVEDEERFKEVNLARDTVVMYLKRYKDDTKKLSMLYNKKSVDLQEENEYLEEYNSKLKALQEVIKITRKSSKFYNVYRKIPIIFWFALIVLSFILIIVKPEILFGFVAGYSLFFGFVIKAANQKQKLGCLLKERKILRKEMEAIEKRIQGINIELYAVKIALESVKEDKKEKLLIEKKEKTA